MIAIRLLFISLLKMLLCRMPITIKTLCFIFNELMEGDSRPWPSRNTKGGSW